MMNLSECNIKKQLREGQIGYLWKLRNDVRLFSRRILRCECNRELSSTYLDEITAMH